MPPGMSRSRSFTRFTMRVGLPHLGQSVLLVVSMTFLRSAVFAIFAIALSLVCCRCLPQYGAEFGSRKHNVKAGTGWHGQREMHTSQAHVLESLCSGVPHSAFFGRGGFRTASTAGGRDRRATLYVPDSFFI